jgi:hypothetical protein
LGSSTGAFDFTKDADKIVDEAKNAGLTLRVMGATAFRIHCPNSLPVHDALGRVLSDLDFVSYSNVREKLEELFTGQLGYQSVRAALTPGLFAGRCIFTDKSGERPRVDVFLDRLEMNHTIDFKGRLETDYPTIPLAELLLEKVQIVKINDKDIKDLIILLLEHDVGKGDHETINIERIVRIMGSDWPFYYTTTTNLSKMRSLLPKYNVLTDEQQGNVTSKIDKLLRAIENEPKSFAWKCRATIGPAKKWYRDVEEIERADHLASVQT